MKPRTPYDQEKNSPNGPVAIQSGFGSANYVPSSNGKISFFENQLLDYKEASRYLSICESYLRRLKAKGHIPFVQIGTRGIRFKIASLDSWIAEREIK